MSGVATSRSTSPNSRSTSSALVASQAKAFAPVSVQSSPSFSIFRAASATLMPSRENSRASEALRPSPAPTIKAVLYFGCAMRAPIDQDSYRDWYLGAHPGEATRCGQDHVEIALVAHAGIFRAQHGKRPRVILLRLLRPDIVAQPDREFFRAFRERLFIGERPGPEQFSDLFCQDRHQGRRQRCPAFEAAFGLRPQHAVDPCLHMRRAAFDQRAGGRIFPE